MACLGLMHSAQAEYMDSEVTVQIKVYYQKNSVTKEPNVTFVGGLVTFKTSDIIQAIGAQVGEQFSSKARLIRRLSITNQSSQISFVIRDPARPIDYSNTFKFLNHSYIPHVLPGRSTINIKGKSNKDTGVSSIKLTSAGITEFQPSNNNLHLQIYGPLTITQKVIPSKQFPGKFLTLLSSSITGIGSYKADLPGVIEQDYAQVTIKFSPPKIIGSF